MGGPDPDTAQSGQFLDDLFIGQFPQPLQTHGIIQGGPGQTVNILGLALGQFHGVEFAGRRRPDRLGFGEGVKGLAVKFGAGAEGLDHESADYPGHAGGYLLPQHRQHQRFKHRGGVGQMQAIEPLHQCGHDVVRPP